MGIRLLCLPLLLIKGRRWMRAREFEENPRSMRFRDIVYFAYKYYFRSPLLPSDNEVLKHFEDAPVHRREFDRVLATVSIGGDLMPYEMIKESNTEALWDETGAAFFGSDLVFANLETPLHDGRKSSYVPEVMLNNMYFNTGPACFRIFNASGKFKGFDVLSIANNHTLDQGYEGIDHTVDYLTDMGISHVGARKYTDEHNYVIKEVNGIKIGFVAWTYSLNEFELEPAYKWKVNLLPLNLPDCPLHVLAENIRECRSSGAELIICSLHCGNAYQAYPSLVTVRLFERIFAECGPDVIAGGHPHNLQPWRSFNFKDPFTGRQKQGFAIYSLADFVAYDIYTWCHLCAFVKLEIGRNPAGDAVFMPLVYPLLMQREGRQLKLVYAGEALNKHPLSEEFKDIKILYDTCMSAGKALLS